MLAKVVARRGHFGFGVLVGAAGLGLTLGSLGAGRWLDRFGLAAPYALGIVLMALGFGAARSRRTSRSRRRRRIVAALGNGAAVVCNSLLVQRGAPDELRGRAFTVIMAPTTPLLGARHGRGRAARRRVRSALGRGAWRGSPTSPRGLACALDARHRAATPARRRGCRTPSVDGPPDWTLDELAAGVRAGDRRALARAITLVENGDPLAYELVRELYPETGKAFVLGVTGPPGVGKSSLIGALVRHVREEGRTVGVISVDPSSPFTQGALLGDRIRLSDHFLDPGVFIRSMGTRGHLGGLAEATLQARCCSTRPGRSSSSSRRSGPGRARSR